MEIGRTIFFHCRSNGGARCILQLSVIESFSIGWMEPVAPLLGTSSNVGEINPHLLSKWATSDP